MTEECRAGKSQAHPFCGSEVGKSTSVLWSLEADALFFVLQYYCMEADDALFSVLQYYYSIKDISVGGRCVCNGHAEACSADNPEKQ
jgi:hypothetical protein